MCLYSCLFVYFSLSLLKCCHIPWNKQQRNHMTNSENSLNPHVDFIGQFFLTLLYMLCSSFHFRKELNDRLVDLFHKLAYVRWFVFFMHLIFFFSLLLLYIDDDRILFFVICGILPPRQMAVAWKIYISVSIKAINDLRVSIYFN